MGSDSGTGAGVFFLRLPCSEGIDIDLVVELPPALLYLLSAYGCGDVLVNRRMMSEAEEIAETFAAASVTNEVQLHSLGLGKTRRF